MCAYLFIVRKKERKVRIEEQKHAKREDNDRFRNYSCVYIQRTHDEMKCINYTCSKVIRPIESLSLIIIISSIDETKAVHLLFRLTKSN